jgi:hypothetical protein
MKNGQGSQPHPASPEPSAPAGNLACPMRQPDGEIVDSLAAPRRFRITDSSGWPAVRFARRALRF